MNSKYFFLTFLLQIIFVPLFGDKISICPNIPVWYDHNKEDNDYYYITGNGIGSNKEDAQSEAKLHVLMQINYAVRSSILTGKPMNEILLSTTNSIKTYSSLFKNLKNDDLTLLKTQKIEKFFDDRFLSIDDKNFIHFTLIKILKKEVIDLQKKYEKDRSDILKNNVSITVISQFPNGTVEYPDAISIAVEDIYRQMGYKIVLNNFDFNNNDLKSIDSVAAAIQKRNDPNIHKSIIVFLKVNKRTSQEFGKTITTASGGLVLKEYDFIKNIVLTGNSFQDRTISFRINPDEAFQQAYVRLISRLVKQLKNYQKSDNLF